MGQPSSLNVSPEHLREMSRGAVVQFEKSPIPSFLWQRKDSDFVFLAFNTAADAFTHRKLHQYVGIKASVMYQDYPEVMADMLRCWSEDVSLKRELKYVMRSTQETKQILATYVPLKPSLVLVHVQDLTEKWEAETRLKESEGRFQALVDMIPVPFLIARLSDGLIVYTNPLLRTLTHDGKVVGRYTQEFYADLHDREVIMGRFAQQGYLRDVEVAVRLPGGPPMCIHVSANPIRFEGNDCVLTTVVDLTEQKLMERAMTKLAGTSQQNSEFLQILVNQLAAALQIRLVLLAERAEQGRWRVRASAGWSASLDAPEYLEGFFWEGAPADLFLYRRTSPKESGEGIWQDPFLQRLNAQWVVVLPLCDSHGESIGLLCSIHDESLRGKGWIEQTIRVFALRAAAELVRERVERDLEAAREKVSVSMERQRELSHELLRSQEREQRRIAQELHDEIGQALTAVQLNLTAMTRPHAEGERERRLLESMTIVDRVLEQTHDLCLDLRPSMLDDLGLASALRWYAERLAERTGLDLSFHDEGVGRDVDPMLATACFRVAQEALTNVSRHAQASDVAVILRRTLTRLELEVSDNGVGFDTKLDLSRQKRHPRLGLLGMEEQVSLVGGNIQIHSRPGNGTQVLASFPLREQEPSLK